MNILITGVTGFIGTHFLKMLKDKYEIHALIRSSTDLAKVQTESIFVFKDNIQDLSTFLKTHKIEGVIHLASSYVAQHQPDQVKDLVLSNVYLGTALLEAASNAGVKWFLNTGTFFQHYQNANYSPVNLYAATKQAFESMAQYYIDTEKIKFCTLLLSDTFGPDDMRPKVFNLWKRISETGESIDMSSGEQLIDITYIEDVISAFAKLVDLLGNKAHCIPNGARYGVCSVKRYTLKELSRIFERVLHTRLNINWGGRPYREREVMIPWENAVIVPEWHPLYSLETALEKTFI